MPNHVGLTPVLFFASSLSLVAPALAAQPTVFDDLGSVAPVAAPPAASTSLDVRPLTPGTSLSVRWIRFDLTQPISGDLFLDVDTTIFTLAGDPGDLFLALYDASGNLLVTDDADGGIPATLAAALSFGSTEPRTSGSINLRGQDGPLAAGQYWLALAAGNAGTVTAGATNWDLTTSQTYTVGVLPGSYLVSLSIVLGNTLPITAPANDLCAGALVLSEDAAPGQPAWTGTTDGASGDGSGPCYATGFPAPLDVWFRYVPTATGFAEAFADAQGQLTTPVLSRFSSECGSDSLQCAGSSSPATLFQPARIVFPVVQGEPVLLALAAFGGQTGPLSLSIRLVPPPCAADFNDDGALDPDDLSDYITCFFSEPPCDQADFSGDGSADPDDLSDFITAFFAGCP